MSASKALAARSLHLAGLTIAQISEALDISESSARKYISNEREADSAFASLCENMESCVVETLQATKASQVKAGVAAIGDLTKSTKPTHEFPEGLTREKMGDEIAKAVGEYILNANKRARGL